MHFVELILSKLFFGLRFCYYSSTLIFLDSLRGKQIYQIPLGSVGDVEHVLALSYAGRSNNKVIT